MASPFTYQVFTQCIYGRINYTQLHLMQLIHFLLIHGSCTNCTQIHVITYILIDRQLFLLYKIALYSCHRELLHLALRSHNSSLANPSFQCSTCVASFIQCAASNHIGLSVRTIYTGFHGQKEARKLRRDTESVLFLEPHQGNMEKGSRF